MAFSFLVCFIPSIFLQSLTRKGIDNGENITVLVSVTSKESNPAESGTTRYSLRMSIFATTIYIVVIL